MTIVTTNMLINRSFAERDLQLLAALYKLYRYRRMKHILFFLLLFFAALVAVSQSRQIRIGRYILPNDNDTEKSLVLKMPFGKYSIDHIIGDTAAFRKAGEVTVDIICTDYPPEQSLIKLNANRLKAFYAAFPFIIPDHVGRVHYYRQTGGTERDKAQPMFHGVVIRWRIAQNANAAKDDWKKLEGIVALAPAIKKTSLREGYSPVTFYKKVEKKTKNDSTAKVPYYDPSMNLADKKIIYIIGDTAWLYKRFTMPDSVPVFDFKKAYKKHLITKRVYQQFKDKRSSYLTLYEPLPEEIPVDYSYATRDTADSSKNKLPDSTIMEVLKRNVWKNAVVVGDVTASMYPYTAQLLIWLQLYSLNSLSYQYVFFNDGNDKPDEKKRPGKTGGIYYQQCVHYDQVKELVKLAMEKGTGGDFPENVTEALLGAEKQFPKAACNMLIADNWAAIRDKELIAQLRKPVMVILCGVRNNDVNIDYLNLALKTKGSVHLMEDDISNLSKLKEGEVLTIGKKNFKIKNGEFVETE